VFCLFFAVKLFYDEEKRYGRRGAVDTRGILKRSPLFSGLSESEIDQVEQVGIKKTYERGEIIFAEADEATGFYVNLSGQVKIYKLSIDGREQILHIIHSAEAFAEAALFAGSTYPAFAEALKRTQVLYFPKESFLRLVRGNPQVGLNMIGGLSFWLRRFVDLVEELSLKDVSARFSKYLLDASVRPGSKEAEAIVVELEVTKTELASRLGTISETLSRVLRKLRDRGIIHVEGRRITILDRGALEEIASGIEF
jgi:CRP/FNR family transcriptional regulator